MRRIAGLAAVAAALWLVGNSIASVPSEGCTCPTTRETNGWCQVHEFGYVGGVEVRSRWLYEYADAHGHEVDLSTYTCPGCKSAIAANGFCEIHRVGFVDKMAYYSLLTYELGKGQPKRATGIACPTCRKNSETHGWCAKSGVGMVGPFAIRNRVDFDRAVSALAVFTIANDAAARCHHCAAAILTDSECPACKIGYKDGKVVARVP